MFRTVFEYADIVGGSEEIQKYADLISLKENLTYFAKKIKTK